MSDDDLWIVIPNWERFQHYTDRNPPWIKLYTELAHDDEWNDLSLTARGLLTTLWIEFCASRGQLRASGVAAVCRQRVRGETLDSLVQAGFVALSASKPLALARAGARARTRSREEISKEISQERGRASERPSARPPAPEQNEQPRRSEPDAPDEPERDPEAAAKIRALAAEIGIRIPSGRPDENGARDDDPFA